MSEQDITQAKAAVSSLMVADTGLSLADLSTVFVKSGFFKDVREQSQAIVKMLVGQELGLKPLQSMMGIHIVEGKPELSAAMLGMLVKRSGKYDYRVLEHTETACELEFFQLDAGARTSLGTSRFTMEDAARAGLAGRNVWKSYPRNMLHARALSNGVRWYCMDALGLPIYTDGEIEQRDNGAPAPVGVIESEAPNPYASRKRTRKSATAEVVAVGNATAIRDALDTVDTPIGAEDCPEPGCWGGRDHPGAHVFDTDAEALKAPPVEVTFTVYGKRITTQGMTEAQFVRSLALAELVDKARGSGHARGVLAKLLGSTISEATRKRLDEPTAAHYLDLLEQALEERA